MSSQPAQEVEQVRPVTVAEVVGNEFVAAVPRPTALAGAVGKLEP